MKEQYLKAVKRALAVPRGIRAEILRDLGEVFASACEHGESEQQVAERLGPPQVFADSAAEQFGIDNAARRKRRSIFSALFFLLVAVCALGIWGSARLSVPAENIIGQANSMTGIQVVGGFDPLWILLSVGLLALLLSVLFLVRALHRGR